MKFYNVFFAAVILLLFAGKAHSQERDLANIGSYYSGYGIGVPADVNSPGTMGMGLSGVSSYSSFTPNLANPAQWGLISFTQGNVSLGLTNYYASDNTATARNSLFGVENFQVALPLYRNKLGVSLSFLPFSRSDYQKFSGGEFDPLPGLNADAVPYENSITGNGGVNRFELGAGYHMLNFLSVGYAFSANLLSLQQESVSVFPSGSGYRSSQFDRSVEGYGFGHRFGVFANFGRLFAGNDQLTIGASVNLPVSIDADESVTTFQTVNGQTVRVELNENAPGRDGRVELPMEINAGLTYNPGRLSNFTAEIQLQNWGDAEYSYSTRHQSFYKDRIRTGFGFQYHPYRSDQMGGFFSNFKYSVGTTYDTGHLAIQGEDIKTLFFNAGLGIFTPGQTSQSSVDFSFQYGIRGTETSSLVKENIWGFKLSLNLAEFMFVRSRFQ